MLTSLFLSRNRISSAGLPALADVVGGLTSLNLSCNALGDGLWQLGRAAALARENSGGSADEMPFSSRNSMCSTFIFFAI